VTPSTSRGLEVAQVIIAPSGVVREATPRARELLGVEAAQPGLIGAWIPAFPAQMWASCGQGAVVSVSCKRRELVVEVLRETTEELTLQVEARREDHPVDAHLDAISRVVTELAHEVNNALTGIVAALDSTLDFEDISPSARILVSNAHSEVLRVAKIVARARRQSRRGDAEIEAVETRRVLDAILRPMRPFFERRKITVLADVPDELAVIYTDASRLLSIVLNLIVNARDALAEHGSTLQVRFDRLPPETASERAWLALTVRDDGIGMDRAELRRAGDLLYTTKKQGTGIGLATVRAMAASLSGSLLLRSTPRHGTLASVFFPDPR